MPDAEAAAHQLRPVMIVRRRGTHRAGGLFRGVGESPRGFRFGIDGDSRARMGGLLEPDYQATRRGAWRQHAVIQDQIDPRARRQRRQPRQQIEWLELQMRGPVRPRAFSVRRTLPAAVRWRRSCATGGRRTYRQSRSRRSRRSAGTHSSAWRSKPLVKMWRVQTAPAVWISAPERSMACLSASCWTRAAGSVEESRRAPWTAAARHARTAPAHTTRTDSHWADRRVEAESSARLRQQARLVRPVGSGC